MQTYLQHLCLHASQHQILDSSACQLTRKNSSAKVKYRLWLLGGLLTPHAVNHWLLHGQLGISLSWDAGYRYCSSDSCLFSFFDPVLYQIEVQLDWRLVCKTKHCFALYVSYTYTVRFFSGCHLGTQELDLIIIVGPFQLGYSMIL